MILGFCCGFCRRSVVMNDGLPSQAHRPFTATIIVRDDDRVGGPAWMKDPENKNCPHFTTIYFSGSLLFQFIAPRSFFCVARYTHTYVIFYFIEHLKSCPRNGRPTYFDSEAGTMEVTTKDTKILWALTLPPLPPQRRQRLTYFYEYPMMKMTRRPVCVFAIRTNMLIEILPISFSVESSPQALSNQLEF